MNRLPKKPAPPLVAADSTVLRRPVHPDLPPRLSAVEARDAVHKAVTELHAGGALDAGNADVLDGWLDSLRGQWNAHAAMAATEHAAIAQQVVGESEAAAVDARQRADAAQAELASAEHVVAAYERELLPGAPEAGRPDRRHRARPAVEQLDGLTASRWSGPGRLLLMVLVGLGDLVTFWMTLQGVFGEDPVVTGVLVGSFTLASMLLMHAAGSTVKGVRAGSGGLGKTGALVLVLAWLGLGAVAFYLRLNAAEPPAGGAAPAFGADPATAAAEGTDPIFSALLLAGLFVASGVLAFWLGFSGSHPRIRAYRTWRDRQSELRGAVAKAERTALAAERLLQNARDEQARVTQRTADATRSIDAEIAELKQLARIHLAGLLGEPAATNAVTTGGGTDPVEPAVTAPRHAANGVWGAKPIKANGHALPSPTA